MKRTRITRHRGLISPLSETVKEVYNQMNEADKYLLTEMDVLSVASDVDADEQMIPLDAKINFHLAIQRGIIEESL